MPKQLIVTVLGAAGLTALALLFARGPGVAWSAPAVKAPPPGGPSPSGAPKSRPSGSPRGPRRPGGDSGRYRHFGKPLSKEQEQEILDYLKTKRPDVYKQTIAYREKDPRRYQRTLRSMWFFVSRLKNLPEKVREAYEVRQITYIEMWQAARGMQTEKDPAEKKRLEARLRELAEKQFDADQIIRGHRLTELAEQVQRLKAELKARADDRENVIRESLERMMKGASSYSGRRPDGPGRGRDKRPPQPDGGPRKPPEKDARDRGRPK